jgi:preprotein translocase subunit SecF
MKKLTVKVSRDKNKFFILSAAVILFGLIMAFTLGLNFGIDFLGGTVVQIDLHTTFETSDIREITDEYDKTCTITSAGDDATQVVISSKVDFTDEQKVTFFDAFKDKYNLSDDDLLSFDNVSATIGKDLQKQALLASLVAVVGILIYITIRFEFLFGITAVIALIHDLLVVIGVYAVFQIPVNSSFIVAILTILGYSINDTIVVFDRIRENRKKYARYDFANLVDDSINQTIKRSVYTSVTTLLAISALYVFGVSSVREFVLPMMIGFISGTYSSIFVASSIWYIIKEKQAEKLQAKLKTR